MKRNSYILVLLVMTYVGCAPARDYSFCVVDAETNAPLSDVAVHRALRTLQPSTFPLAPPVWFPIETGEAMTSDATGIVAVCGFGAGQSLEFKRDGYHSVVATPTWGKPALSTIGVQLPSEESSGALVVRLPRLER